jgi:hypothetical protein
LGAAGLVQAPVAGLQTPATWQASEAAQLTGEAPVHTPAWQVSLWVQALPSLHAVPLGAAGVEHTPVAGLHTPATWQASAAEQVTEAPPVQLPAWQLSPWVQALPSLHEAPLGAAGLLQAPVAGSQTPATWQASEAAQLTGEAPVHTPA